MNEKILNLKAKSFYCPLCHEWHDIEGHSAKLSDWAIEGNEFIHTCIDETGVKSKFWIELDKTTSEYHLKGKIIHRYCDSRLNVSIDQKISNLKQDIQRSCIIIPFKISEVGLKLHDMCNMYPSCSGGCKFYKNGDYFVDDWTACTVDAEFEFKFDSEEFNKCLEEPEEQIKIEETMQKETKTEPKQDSIKEDVIMNNNKKKVTIKEQLWEHSPKENFEIFKNWCVKYKDTFRWAVPVVCIYGAYKILKSTNSGLTTENISNECKKKLGFSFECLENNKALKRLLVLGGMSATAVTVINVFSSIYNKNGKNNIGDISTEEIEAGLESAEKAHQNLNWISPETEKLLPVATSVIIVYLMTQKPEWFEKLKSKISSLTSGFTDKASTYFDLAKLFIADKLHVDFDNEEECKKFKLFALLGITVGVGVVLYGKGILGKKANTDDSEQNSKKNKNFEVFTEQVLEIMKKLMPTAFAGITTFLVTKHVLKDTEPDSSVIDSDFTDSEADAVDSNENTETEAQAAGEEETSGLDESNEDSTEE